MNVVVPIGVTNVNDIPAKLRQLADDIEGGGYGDVRGLVYALTDGGDVCADMMGRIGAIEACGLFTLGNAMVANIYCQGFDE